MKSDVKLVKDDAIRRKNIRRALPAARREALVAMAAVSEGFCPICNVELEVHGDQACCPCGGCSFRLKDDSVLLGVCPLHPPRSCEHWNVLWRESGF